MFIFQTDAQMQTKKPGKEDHPKKLDLTQKLGIIPTDTNGMRKHVHSFSVDSGSDFRSKKKFTPEQENRLYSEGIDVQARPEVGLLSPQQKHLITERGINLFKEGGKYRFSKSLTKLHLFGTDMAIMLPREVVYEVTKWLASLPEEERVKALYHNGDSEAANMIFDALKGRGLPVTEDDRHYWVKVGFTEANGLEISKARMRSIEESIGKDRLARQGKKKVEKPVEEVIKKEPEITAFPIRPLTASELWKHPKEDEILGKKVEQVDVDITPVKEKKSGKTELGPFDMSNTETKPLGWQEKEASGTSAAPQTKGRGKAGARKPETTDDLVWRFPETENDFNFTFNNALRTIQDNMLARAQQEAMERRQTAAEKAPVTAVDDENIPVAPPIKKSTKGNDDASGWKSEEDNVQKVEEKTVKVKERRKKEEAPEDGKKGESIFTKYKEFNGEEPKTGIKWIDDLWSSSELMTAYEKLSGDPQARKRAVEEFVQYVIDNPGQYKAERDAEGVILEIQSFKK